MGLATTGGTGGGVEVMMRAGRGRGRGVDMANVG